MTTIGLLGQCCGGCVTGPMVWHGRSTSATQLWFGDVASFYDTSYTLSDPNTAYLQTVLTTSFPDLTAIFGAGWEAESQVITCQINRYTGAWTITTAYSSNTTNYGNRYGLFSGMVGVSFSYDTANDTNVIYNGRYNPGSGLIIVATAEWDLSIPWTVAQANALAVSLLAATTPPGSLAWDQIDNATYDASGNPVNTITTGYGATFGPNWSLAALGVAANLPMGISGLPQPTPGAGDVAFANGIFGVGCLNASGPYTTTSGFSNLAQQQAGQVQSNFSYWYWFQDEVTGAWSACNYLCYPVTNSGPPSYTYIYGAAVITTFNPPGSYGSTLYAGDSGPPGWPTGPCGGASPACSGWR